MKYRKKPVIIEAVQWTGNNISETLRFVGKYAELIIEGQLFIKTLEGVMCANVGDYIIRGVAGEYYPCNPDIFAATYEPYKEADHEKN